MSDRTVITALLETGDSFLHLEDHEITEETAEQLDYRPENIEEYTDYVSKALTSEITEDLISYHTVADKLIENPEILYENNLLRPEVYKKVEDHLDLLRSNRDRSLNLSEIEAVINTTMEQEKPFQRKAIDKEKLVENLYIGVYNSAQEDLRQEGLGHHFA